MAKKLTTLEKDYILRRIAYVSSRIRRIEGIFGGEKISNVRIDTVSVSKLVSGILGISANLGEENIKIDGVNNRILINDGDYDRVLIGNFGDGTYGIKVSQVGKDVKTCGDEDLIMSSELNTLKTNWAGEIGPNDYHEHNLGYKPIHLYGQYTGEKINYLAFIGQQDISFLNSYGWITSDNTKIENINNSGFGDFIKVFIFYDPITP